MNRRERLTRTLEGKPVDRPPVNFFELNGYHQDPDNMDPFNIFNDPSWQPLLNLAKEKSDRIVLFVPQFKRAESEHVKSASVIDEHGSRLTTTTITTPKGILTERTRRDPDIDTVWTLEHFIKNKEDIYAYLSLPETEDIGVLDTQGVFMCDEAIGDTGLTGIDFGDAICRVAPLFSMADFTVFALTEQALFTRMMQRAQRDTLARLEAISSAFPGRHYRVVGSEYASPPYLPPSLHYEYIVKYDTEVVKMIQASGGYARIHSHGNLARILDGIADTGADGIDPIEPTPQGDVSLKEVKARYGGQMVLFGNIEVSELETLSADAFRDRVKSALDEGMSGPGRGFVLMPSSCPYGRKLSYNTYRNYEIMVELAENARY